MKIIKIEDRTFTTNPENVNGDCHGCAADISNMTLCNSLNKKLSCTAHDIIFVEVVEHEPPVQPVFQEISLETVKSVVMAYHHDSVTGYNSGADLDTVAAQVLRVIENQKLKSSEEYKKYIELKQKFSHID